MLAEKLQNELDDMKKGSANLSNLRAEHSKLKDDFRNLFTTSERLKHEYKNLQVRNYIILFIFFQSKNNSKLNN